MEQRGAAGAEAGTGVATAVVCGQASRTWRCQLDDLARATLEELALTDLHDDQGWASPVGVRAVATSMGASDAAAVRALTALDRACLVALEPVTDRHGQRRCLYWLDLLLGIELRDSPCEENTAHGVFVCGRNDRDAGSSSRGDHHQKGQDGPICPADQHNMSVRHRPVLDYQSGGRGTKEPR